MFVRARFVTHIDSTLRTRALASSCAMLLLALAGCTSSQSDPRGEFAADLAIDGAEASHARALQPGAYLLEAREAGIDVHMVVDLPGHHYELADEVPRHGLLANVVSLSAPAELRITIRNADHSTRKGTVRVSIARWQRALDAAPGELERGYAAFAAAGELDAQDDPAVKQTAADRLHEAISHFKAARAVAARAQAQYTLANFLNVMGTDPAGAIRAADAAADGFKSLDDEVGAADASTVRAAAQLDLASAMNASTQRAEQAAMFDDADRRLREAFEFFAPHALPLRAAYAVNQRGLRALYEGDYELAGKLFAQAVEMSRANADLREQAVALSNLAWVNNRRGFIAQAAEQYEAMLPMVEKENQPLQYATTLVNYGFCLVALGDFDRALALHNEGLEIFTAHGREMERAIELAALGGLYFRIGDTQRALDILRIAIAAHEKVGDRVGQASALRIAGNAASALGQHEAALAYLQKSAEIDANQNSAARTRVLIAGEMRALGNLRGAATELTTAFASDNALVHANALQERALLHGARGERDQAIADLRAADREYVELGLEFNRIDTNTTLSRELLLARDLRGAAAAADNAVDIASRIRAKSANPEWRAHFLSFRYAPYEARIAVELAGEEPDAVWRAFRTAEQVRARSLADQLALGSKRPAVDADREVEGLRAKLTSLQMRLETRTQKQGTDDPDAIELRRAIEETRARIDADRPAVAARENDLPGSLSALQDKLPRGTAVLAYFVGDFDSHAWLVTRDSFRHKRLPGLAGLQKDVEATVNVTARGADAGEALASLGSKLLGGLLDGVQATHMLLICDGPLNSVPFAALPTGGRNGELLVDRFVIGYAPSLTLAMAAPPHGGARHQRVAVVSDPVYAPDDRRLKLAMGTNGGTYRGPSEASRSQLTRLPYSALEAKAVIRALGGKNAVTLDGFAATASKVLALSSADLGVLHFATHALARRDAPEQSALYLSEYTTEGKLVDDNRITVGEIARSGLRADVVVLSGCSTGDGSELRGEGVLGLTYGFLANGSQAVVASLWPIEDASTARFMSAFYGAYRANAQPAEALRAAQLRTRGAVATAVWSSFVVRANGFP
jgi:tetratricopeptide (TPR) repeat protein/phosphotransferase system HPr-like phosphotransfer protein